LYAVHMTQLIDVVVTAAMIIFHFSIHNLSTLFPLIDNDINKR
jgi:hypothetical protein